MNKTEFLKAVCGGSFDYELEGFGVVKVKGLSVNEMREVAEQGVKDPYVAALLTVVYGLVDPKLDPSDVEALGNANTKIVTGLAERISELSGVERDESPLAGNGSE